MQPLLTRWRNTPQIAANVVAWKTIPPREAQTTPFPDDLHPALAAALHRQGIDSLYTHQARAWELARGGHHFVVVTGTASGKTLCYNLPVLDRLLRHPTARALYLFPTKALAHDQYAVASQQCSLLNTGHSTPNPATYDGDTPRAHRPKSEKNLTSKTFWIRINLVCQVCQAFLRRGNGRYHQRHRQSGWEIRYHRVARPGGIR